MQVFKIIKIILSGFGAAGTTFLLQVIVSHYLPITDFGFYAASNSLLSIVGPLASVGISGLFLRRACVTPAKTEELLGVSLSSLLCTTIISFIITAFVFYKSNINLSSSLSLATFYFPIALQYLFISFFQAREKYNIVSLFQSMLPTLRLLFVAISIFVTASLQSISYALAASHLVALLIFYFISKSFFSLKKIAANQSIQGGIKFFKESVYYSLNGTLNVAQIQISTIICIFLFGSASSAMYSSANTILAACYILPNLVFGTYFLPKYHKLEIEGSLEKLPVKHGMYSLAVGAVVTMLIVVSAKFIIGFIYPSSFKESANILQILSLSLPFRFFSTAVGASLLSEQSVKKKLFASLISITLQSISVFIFSQYGINFLAVSYVFSELAIAILYYLIFSSQYRKLNFTIQ
jgi:O-antigen/teichoic acid export membrane protein